MVVVHEELSFGEHGVLGFDVNAIPDRHEVAVAKSVVDGIDKSSYKMPLSVPKIVALACRFTVQAVRLTGHPLDVIIALSH